MIDPIPPRGRRVLLHFDRASGQPKSDGTERHAMDCYVPDQRPNRGKFRTFELTEEVRANFQPCRICGGGGR